jgi:Zn-dependent peptidase ImmA (M78 family)
MSEEEKTEEIWRDNRYSGRIRITVNESILAWAVKRSGRGSELEQNFPKLSKWLRGEIQPTFRELQKFSKATYTPFGYFFFQKPPVEPLSIPHFRTFGNQTKNQEPSPDLIETVQMMERRQNWMRDYLIAQGHEPLDYVHSAQLTESTENVANKIRNALELSVNWAAEQPNWGKALETLRLKMENAGIIVVVNSIVGNNTRRKLDTNEFRGFVLVDEYAPLVFVNGADGKAAQMFTLAHEFAHIIYGKSAIFDLIALQPADDKIEKKCNGVAAEFLVPRDQLKAFWPSIAECEDPFQEIAQKFKVSEIVAAYRTLNLGIIQKKEFYEFYKKYLSVEHRKSEKGQGGGNFYTIQNLRLGQRFAIAVICAAREGSLLYRDAYNLTGLHGDTFELYAKTIGIP